MAHDSDSLDSPAYDPYVIAVGAEDSGGTAIAGRRRRGAVLEPRLGHAQPGRRRPRRRHRLRPRVPGSFLDEAFPAARASATGFRGTGTSQAAAVVSGAAAAR